MFFSFQARWAGLPLPISDYLTDTKSALDQCSRILHALVDITADAGWLGCSLRAATLMQSVVQGQWTWASPFASVAAAAGIPRGAVPRVTRALVRTVTAGAHGASARVWVGAGPRVAPSVLRKRTRASRRVQHGEVEGGALAAADGSSSNTTAGEGQGQGEGEGKDGKHNQHSDDSEGEQIDDEFDGDDSAAGVTLASLFALAPSDVGDVVFNALTNSSSNSGGRRPRRQHGRPRGGASALPGQGDDDDYEQLDHDRRSVSAGEAERMATAFATVVACLPRVDVVLAPGSDWVSGTGKTAVAAARKSENPDSSKSKNSKSKNRNSNNNQGKDSKSKNSAKNSSTTTGADDSDSDADETTDSGPNNTGSSARAAGVPRVSGTTVRVGLCRLNAWVPLSSTHGGTGGGASSGRAAALAALRSAEPAKVMGPRDVKVKREGWWVFIGRDDSDELYAVKRVTIGLRRQVVALELGEGAAKGRYTAYLVSDCYLGLDQRLEFELI